MFATVALAGFGSFGCGPYPRPPVSPGAANLPDWSSAERRLGTIQHYSDSVRVTVPAEVDRAVEFVVEVVTYGNGCVRRGDTVGLVSARVAEVMPYDWALSPGPNGPECTEELKRFVHRALIAFDAPGEGVVRVRGLGEPGGEEILSEWTVRVR